MQIVILIADRCLHAQRTHAHAHTHIHHTHFMFTDTKHETLSPTTVTCAADAAGLQEGCRRGKPATTQGEPKRGRPPCQAHARRGAQGVGTCTWRPRQGHGAAHPQDPGKDLERVEGVLEGLRSRERGIEGCHGVVLRRRSWGDRGGQVGLACAQESLLSCTVLALERCV
jgi:hypothetical protein